MKKSKSRLNTGGDTCDLLFIIALDISVAQEALEDRGQPVTFQAIKQELLAGKPDATVTDERIRQGLAQVARWDEQRKALTPSIRMIKRRPPRGCSLRKVGPKTHG